MKSQDKLTLPEQFEELEKWCDIWCLNSISERNKVRYGSSMDDIRDFYDSVQPRAESILEYLSGFQLGELTPEQENLLRLMLSLAEIGPAIEWFGQPKVIDGFDPKDFPLVLSIPENSPQ